MMEVSPDNDTFNEGLNTVLFSTSSSLNEVEDGELIEDTNSEEEKKILRAKRFGQISNVTTTKPQDPRLQRLYKRMKVNDETRLEALYLHGTDSMKTEDIFALFSGHTPASVEWLTDKTCNAVWLDEESCAKGLINCSVKIKGQSPEESEDSEEECINQEDLRCTLPPGGVWRRSKATNLAPNLFMRYATYSDRRGNKPFHQSYDPLRRNFVFLDEGDEVTKKIRQVSGNPWADIAKEWSYFEMKSAAKKIEERPLIRDARDLLNDSGRAPSSRSRGSKDDFHENPTMVNDKISIGRKMQADIEEKKILTKKLMLRNPRPGANIDLRQKLSRKRSAYHYDDSDEDLSDKAKKCKKYRKKMDKEKSWVRSESEMSESDNDDINIHKVNNADLRRKLQNSSDTEKEPLRKQRSAVIVKSSKKFIPDTPLQIEIDNEIYFERLNRT